MRLSVVGLAMVMFATVAPMAAAQGEQPTPSEIAAARSLFQSGLEAAKKGRWREARIRFLRSYNIAQRPATMLNLARAEKETKHFVEAVDHYRRFLATVQDGPLAQFRDEAEQSLAEAKRRSSAIIVRVVGLHRDDALEVDKQLVPRDVLGVPFALNPGKHRVRVVRDGRGIRSTSLRLREGERRNLELTVPVKSPVQGAAAAPSAGDSLRETPEDSGGGLFSSPVFWVSVAVVLAAGATAATLWILSNDDDEQAPQGNLGPGTIEF